MSLRKTLEAQLHLPWIPLYTQEDSISQDASDYSIVQYWVLFATIAFTLTVFLFEDYLDARQKRAYELTEFPTELEAIVQKMDNETKQRQEKEPKSAEEEKPKDESNDKKDNEEDETKEKTDRNKPILPQLQVKFTKAQSYGYDKIKFSMLHSMYEVCESIVFLLLGVLPYLWDLATFVGKEKFDTENEIYVSLIFMGIMTVIGTVTSLPWELYSTFNIEKKHGFNKQTPMLFFTDKIKGLGLTIAIGGPFLALLLKIIQWGGEHFYLYVWLFTFTFSMLMMTVYPVLIMPLFNKYDPLPDGRLKDDIYALAGKLKYPLQNLFVMDGSKRSSHSNAFMYGFGSNKRIVLFDTLLTQVHDSEILAILGHELGHWKLGHTISNLVISQSYTGASFYCFACCYNSTQLYTAFGFSSSQSIPTLIALTLFFQTVWAPIDKVLSFLVTLLTRHFEFQADQFSADLNMSNDLQSGLCKIHLENLGSMCPDWLYATYHYSHPHLVERLGAMMKSDIEKKSS